MRTLSLAQFQSRPPTNPYCDGCALHNRICDGTSEPSLFGCFHNCCGGRKDCDDICPHNPRFAERLANVYGLRFDAVQKIVQREVDLPIYVPHLNHQYSRYGLLQWPVVAVTTYDLFRQKDKTYTAYADSPQALRTHLKLGQDTRIILRGTDKDPALEEYWEFRLRDSAPEQLSKLGVDLVIGPNFSHFIDVVRPDNNYNRARQLMCLEEMQTAGVNVAPHLSAATERDWDFWRGYLADNPGIKYVAKEFQTGNKPVRYGMNSVDEIEAIQQYIGRPLHVIMIGGARLTEYGASRFEQLTILDSRPFMSALNRRAFQSRGRPSIWTEDPTLPGFGIDGVLLHNFELYSAWIAMRAKSKATLRNLRHRRAG